jgi:fatty acid-binding protein DegV
MKVIWYKLRPHIFAWHMLPCLAMLVVALVVLISTGRVSGVFGALGCMLMMTVMMSMMGGHDHGHSSGKGHGD